MKDYLEMRDKRNADPRRNFSMENDLPNHKHITGKKQIDFKLRKRENNSDKHGYVKVQEMLKTKKKF